MRGERRKGGRRGSKRKKKRKKGSRGLRKGRKKRKKGEAGRREEEGDKKISRDKKYVTISGHGGHLSLEFRPEDLRAASRSQASLFCSVIA